MKGLILTLETGNKWEFTLGKFHYFRSILYDDLYCENVGIVNQLLLSRILFIAFFDGGSIQGADNKLGQFLSQDI